MLEFLSTPSARRATQSSTGQSCRNAHFYPRPPRGGRHGWESDRETIIDHFYPRPPRGGRHFRRMMMLRDHEISIHALREEGDTSRLTFFLQASKFLSTPSARRATALHPPESASNGISIHALREEGDGPVGAIVGASTAFLSTPSARRATQGMYKADLLLFVFLSTPSARRATYG